MDSRLFTSLPKKRRSICHHKLHRYHINSYYADDIAQTTNDLSEANTLLLLIEEKANEIGLKTNSRKTEYMRFNQNEKTKSIIKSL